MVQYFPSGPSSRKRDAGTDDPQEVKRIIPAIIAVFFPELVTLECDDSLKNTMILALPLLFTGGSPELTGHRQHQSYDSLSPKTTCTVPTARGCDNDGGGEREYKHQMERNYMTIV